MLRLVPEQTAQWQFVGSVTAADLARHRTADALMAWGYDHFRADAVVVVSELVTNAVIHAQSATQLLLRCDGATLWIGVRDEGPGRPTLREWRHDDQGGLGLRLVDSISESWHVEHDDGGKTVWCRLVQRSPDSTHSLLGTERSVRG